MGYRTPQDQLLIRVAMFPSHGHCPHFSQLFIELSEPFQPSLSQ